MERSGGAGRVVTIGATLLFVLCGAASLQAPRVEARTADGRFVARIERAEGQEKVPESLARYRLNVSEIGADAKESPRWSVLYPFELEPARFVLAPGGRAFAEARERFREGRMVLTVQTPGGRTTWTGGELGITRDDLGGDERDQWLDPARELTAGWIDGPFGPRLDLTLPTRATDRHVDLLDSTLTTETSVLPAAVVSSERTAVPYVRSVEVPRIVSAGGPIEIEIVGNHATPNWRFLGFELELGEQGATHVLHLTPRSEAPDGQQAQVLSVFRAKATIQGLPVGRYTLRVEGWSPGGPPTVLDVRPRHLLARLDVSGGFAGVRRRYELFDVGLLRRELGAAVGPQFLDLDAAAFDPIVDALAALPAKDRAARTERAADLFQYELTFHRDGTWATIRVDDLAATEAEKAAFLALQGP